MAFRAAHYYLSARHLWPAWLPPISPRSPRPVAAFYADPVDLQVLRARGHPAFLGDPQKLHSHWGHSARDSRASPRSPLPPISCLGHHRDTARAGGPGCLVRAGPCPGPTHYELPGTLSGTESAGRRAATGLRGNFIVLFPNAADRPRQSLTGLGRTPIRR